MPLCGVGWGQEQCHSLYSGLLQNGRVEGWDGHPYKPKDRSGKSLEWGSSEESWSPDVDGKVGGRVGLFEEKHSPSQIHKGMDLDRHVRPEVER